MLFASVPTPGELYPSALGLVLYEEGEAALPSRGQPKHIGVIDKRFALS